MITVKSTAPNASSYDKVVTMTAFYFTLWYFQCVKIKYGKIKFISSRIQAKNNIN